MAKEGSRASWNFMYEKGLVDAMAECVQIPMYRCDNSWTKEGWQSISNRFNAMFPTAGFTKQQMQEKDKELKASYKSIRDARSESGVGWNDALSMINAEAHTWEKLIKANSKISKFKKKPFPLYNSLAAIHEGNIATGNLNFTSLDQVESTSGRPSSEQRGIVHASASDGQEASSAPRSNSGQSTHPIAPRSGNSGMVLVGISPFRSGFDGHTEAQSIPSDQNEEGSGKKRKQSQIANKLGDFIDIRKSQIEKSAANLDERKRSEVEYSSANCIAMVDAMEELTDEQKADANELFQSAMNREIFVNTKNPNVRLIWLKKKISQMSKNH